MTLEFRNFLTCCSSIFYELVLWISIDNSESLWSPQVGATRCLARSMSMKSASQSERRHAVEPYRNSLLKRSHPP